MAIQERLFPVPEVYVPYDAPTGELPNQADDSAEQVDGQLEIPLSLSIRNILGGVMVYRQNWNMYNAKTSQSEVR